ncbi:hypothetical protein L210DRAFT_3047114 [Boletus edulis BED1]|uniref:Uncharacterized protein n=1 Tax=Boletus edulis BED1 TaxID=1328754 RepID=A0AAD4C0E8_BOLED|nr:hypothetical protein L210DRAFT_3047114 [Boletus edulis BED1]
MIHVPLQWRNAFIQRMPVQSLYLEGFRDLQPWFDAAKQAGVYVMARPGALSFNIRQRERQSWRSGPIYIVPMLGDVSPVPLRTTVPRIQSSFKAGTLSALFKHPAARLRLRVI